ncbi:MAG: hypothetical protein HYU53_01580 [Acidobacteria bacterium]|nr:hypothetical protein [Acidobacteriota bacterium]
MQSAVAAGACACEMCPKGVSLGSENRIQELNRELRELAIATRREREEFRDSTTRNRRGRYVSQPRTKADDQPADRKSDE